MGNKIKAGDYVIIQGEGLKVFKVAGVYGDSVDVCDHTVELIEKCTKIPKKHHNHIHTVVQKKLDLDGYRKITKNREQKESLTEKSEKLTGCFFDLNNNYMFSSKKDCVKNGYHLTWCDNDGYCNYCGEQ